MFQRTVDWKAKRFTSTWDVNQHSFIVFFLFICQIFNYTTNSASSRYGSTFDIIIIRLLPRYLRKCVRTELRTRHTRCFVSHTTVQVTKCESCILCSVFHWRKIKWMYIVNAAEVAGMNFYNPGFFGTFFTELVLIHCSCSHVSHSAFSFVAI